MQSIRNDIGPCRCQTYIGGANAYLTLRATVESVRLGSSILLPPRGGIRVMGNGVLPQQCLPSFRYHIKKKKGLSILT